MKWRAPYPKRRLIFDLDSTLGLALRCRRVLYRLYFLVAVVFFFVVFHWSLCCRFPCVCGGWQGGSCC